MKEQRVALYRKYRPEDFDSVVGQDHITIILKNALLENLVSHAYLFSGPRGTGKTSVARILAKALNCEKRLEHNPCGKCSNCKAIKEGSSIDVIEIDAASNRGVDEIRDLREKIKFSPTESLYKVFIIDEIHMLTKEAFNALLKTLEEPPSHAFFILATTEINKVPNTIISRCQRHDFRRVKLAEINNKLTQISKKEKIKISEEGIALISEISDGGLRDALSILDQLASAGSLDITISEIVDMVGIAPHQKVYEFVEFLLKKKAKEATAILSLLDDSNYDLIVFTKAVQEFLSKIIMLKIGGTEQIEGTKEQVEFLERIAHFGDIDDFVFLSEEIMKAQKSFRSGVDPSFVLLILVLNITNSPEDVAEKSEPKPIKAKSKEVKKTTNNTEEGPILDKRTNGQWQHFLLEIKSKNNTLHAFLRVASPVFSEKVLTLNFPYKFHKEKMEEIKNKKMVEEVVSKIYGKDYQLKCILEANGGNGKALTGAESAVSILGGELVKD